MLLAMARDSIRPRPHPARGRVSDREARLGVEEVERARVDGDLDRIALANAGLRAETPDQVRARRDTWRLDGMSDACQITAARDSG
jgi:hypothetical protein